MEHRITDLSATEKKVEFTFPSAELEAKISETLKQFKKMVRLPGFRPGHVPDGLVRSRFKKEIQEETIEHLMKEHLDALIKEQGWQLVGDPHVDGETIETEKESTVQVHLHLLPSFAAPEVDGLEIKEMDIAVTDEEVRQAVENLRRSRASLNTIEGPAGSDHYVLGDLFERSGGDEKEKAFGAKLFQPNGPDAVPELLGKKAGDEVTYVKDYPADDSSEHAGRKVYYRIAVREVKEMILPSLDDTFAASISKNKTLAELNTMIAENLRAEKEADRVTKQRADVMDQLLARVDIPIPEPLLESEKRGYLRKLAAQLYTQAVDIQKVDWEKLGKDYEPRAVRNLQSVLLLKKLADTWNIQVTDEELLNHIREDCRRRGQDFAKTMKKYREEDLLDDVRMDLRMSRTWDALFEKIGSAGPKA